MIRMMMQDRQKTVYIAGIIIIISLLCVIPFPWNHAIDETTADIFLKLRGERKSTSEIVLIYIGEDDIQTLGGWPITRDYYSYLIHILNQKGAKTIAFDLLFDTPSSVYPEFDTTLAYFLRRYDNVILPYAFNTVLQNDAKLPDAEQAIFPISLLGKNANRLGFSNLGMYSEIPLVISYHDSLTGSLGFEMARHYLDHSAGLISVRSGRVLFGDKPDMSDRWPCNLRLNYLGGVKQFTSYSLIELFQIYQQNPDSLDLQNKLVFTAVISPGRCSLRSTVLTSAFPASLVHLTAAENLIEKRYLRIAPLYIALLMIILPGFVLLFFTEVRKILIQAVLFIIVYSCLCYLLFVKFYVVLPLFYPLAAQLALMISVVSLVWRRSAVQNYSQRILLQDQLSEKQAQYEELEEKLDRLESEIDREQDTAVHNETLIGEIRALEKQIRDLQEYTTINKPQSYREFPEIIHAPDSGMARVLELAVKVNSDTIPVLILGETGTGKEMIARTIHFSGKRRHESFIAVNCGALPDTLLESELFGHEKGSFTGATGLRRGRFETANKGTLFLDEVTETSAAFQVKLLRVLQEGHFQRLGGEKLVNVDVRIIAASGRNINNEIKQGKFREDLFYRLNGFPIRIPPLRDRKDDVPLLALHFLKKHGYNTLKGFSEEAMTAFTSYQWPGNIRELENIVRRCAILAQSEGRTLVQIGDLPQELLQSRETMTPYQSLEQQILELLRSLKFSHSAITKTAKILGNRDRGTITEYFRGICFEHYVNSGFEFYSTITKIAGSEEAGIVKRVEMKVKEYLNNVYQTCRTADPVSVYKGLPKKYHTFLDQMIPYFRGLDEESVLKIFTE